MSNIDKQALREAAEKALPAMQRLLMMPNDELFDEAQLNVDGDVDAANAFNLLTGPETMLALLDEIDTLQPFRTAFTEWHDKTEWVQGDKRLDVIKPWGKHRADAMKLYIEHLESKLEAAESYAKERDEENQGLMLTVGRLRVEREAIDAERGNALCELLPGVQYMDPPDGGNVTPLEQVRRMIADYRHRIAELEARTVTLPQRLQPGADGYDDWYVHSADDGEYLKVDDVIEAIRAAGIGVKGE